MSAGTDCSAGVELDVDGLAAPPRSNGELVFGEPWESRAFGMAVTLVDAGLFTWDQFRDHLVARVAAHEASPDFQYYRCWLEALEAAVSERGAVAATELDRRGAELAERPAGHDHDHDH